MSHLFKCNRDVNNNATGIASGIHGLSRVSDSTGSMHTFFHSIVESSAFGSELILVLDKDKRCSKGVDLDGRFSC